MDDGWVVPGWSLMGQVQQPSRQRGETLTARSERRTPPPINQNATNLPYSGTK